MVREFTLTNFDKGVNRRENPSMIQDKQFSELNNYIVDEGLLKVREGETATTLLNGSTGYTGLRGLYEYTDTSIEGGNPNTLIAAQGLYLKAQMTSADTWDTIDAQLDILSYNHVNFAKFGDGRVYFVDGVNPVKSIYANGSIFSRTDIPITDSLTELQFYKIDTDYYVVGNNTANKRIERWKHNGTNYVFDINISTVATNGYTGIAYNSVTNMFYGIQKSTAILEQWDDSGNKVTVTLTGNTVTEAAGCMDVVNDCYYAVIKLSSLVQYILKYTISSGNWTLTAITSSTMLSITYFESKIFYSNNNTIFYFDIGSSYVRFFNSDELCSAYGSYLYTTKSRLLNTYNSSLVIVSSYVITVAPIIYINAGVNTLSELFIFDNLSNYNSLSYTNIINSAVKTYYEQPEIIKTMTIATTTGTPFRAGEWYFFYQVLKYENGDQFLTSPIAEMSYTVSAATGLTLTPNLYTLGTNDIFIFYARHETESTFYEIGRTTEAHLDVTAALNPLVFFEERDIYNPPPSGVSLIASYRDMMWYAKGDTMYVSNYTQAMNVPRIIMTETGDFMGGIYPVGNDKLKITALYQFHGYLFIFKENVVYRISGDPGDLATFRIDKMGDVGCKNQRCVCDNGQMMFVYNKNGIYMINEQQVGACISEEINDDLSTPDNSPLRQIVYDYKAVSLCYHEKYKRVLLLINKITNTPAKYVWCLNLKNNTWTKLNTMPVGIPIVLSYLGTDLHIEDGAALKKVFDCVATNITCSFRTKRFNYPSPALYKQFHEADIYCEGTPGITFVITDGVTKSKVTLDGVDRPDVTTIIYPGSYVSRQRIRNRSQKCSNFSLYLISVIAANNTNKHAVSSITFNVNEKGGMMALPITVVSEPTLSYLPDVDTWDDNLTWSDSVTWRK